MRYRGYYYDRDLGLYYLQSRFYDAETGWFINAGGYVSTGQGLLSQNMFAYCLNNPVNMQDDSGMIVVNARITNYLVQLLKFSYKCLKADIKNFDIDNEDEKKVLGASYFSAYKKVPVIKLPIGNNAFSFGAMFIGTENDKSDVNTIRHEYGHSKQFKEIGPLNYTIFVATPSLIGYWRDVPYADYYSQPWEYGADKLGGVERNGYPYAEDAEEQYRIYWDAVRFR